MADRVSGLLVRWIAQQSGAKVSITSATLATVTSLVRSLAAGGRFYDNGAVIDTAQAAGDAVRDAQVAMGAATQTYLDGLLQAMDTPAPRPRDVAAMPTALRETPPLIQWERPAEQYRYARSIGQDEDTALEAAVARAQAMVAMDVSLAQREATSRHLSAMPEVAEVRGYRRVIHPELSTSGTCGLCIAAATRMYYVSELMDIHEDCQCTTSPVIGEDDPGLRLNEEDLKGIYAAAGSTGAADLKAVRYKTVDHGELGPVLTPAGAPRRTPRKAAGAAQSAPPPERVELARHQIGVLEANLPQLLARRAAGEMVDEPIAYHERRLKVLRATVAAG